MKNIIGIVEVGSTNTKSSVYQNGELKSLPIETIMFKNHYKEYGRLLEEDIDKLVCYVENIKAKCEEVYVFGTSIFRKLTNEQKEAFLARFYAETHLQFQIVTPEQENEYTVKGCVQNVTYPGNIAVMIGGGGSTELSIVKDQQIIEMANSDYGAMDLTHMYPDLAEDFVQHDFKDILNSAKKLTKVPNNKADVLILAGGDFILFYELAKYQLKENRLYVDKDQPYGIEIDEMRAFDEQFMKEYSLNQIKEENPKLIDWINGMQGMRFCVEAICEVVQAKYIIPTSLNMTNGIIYDILNKNIHKI